MSNFGPGHVADLADKGEDGMAVRKPVFLILDFHYGLYQMNKAHLENLGFKTHSICASSHYLRYECPNKFMLTEFLQKKAKFSLAMILSVVNRMFRTFFPNETGCFMGRFLRRIYRPACFDNKEQCRKCVDILLKESRVRKTILKCDYIVCSFFPNLVVMAAEIAQRYDKQVFFLSGHRFNIHLKTEAQNTYIKKTIQTLAKNPKHIVAVYGEYETRYMKYFLPELKFSTFPLTTPHVQLLENTAKRGKKTKVFLSAYFHHYETIINEIKLYLPKQHENLTLHDRSQAQKSLPQFDIRKDAYPMCLTYFDAIIYFPHAAYSCSFCEMYELNVPIFVPSVQFLIAMTKVYGHAVRDRSLYSIYCSEDEYKKMEPDDDPKKSPNSYRTEALEIWLPRMEYYQRKNIITFDSIEDLSVKLIRTDYAKISAAMYKENEERREKSKALWQTAINRSWRHRDVPPK